jgi:hypothetical protein
MHEAMSRYQHVYGLRPIGPHRHFADRVLGRLRRLCHRCRRRGVITMDENQWLACSDCGGTGGIWARPPDEVEAARRRVLERFPEAAAGPIGRFLGVPLAQRLATGEMVSLGPSADAGRQRRRGRGRR